MKTYPIIINTFKNIYIPQDKKPIVICDIDLTFIRPIHDYIYVHNKIKHQYSNPVQLDYVVKNLLNIYLNVGVVKHTDQEGFNEMFEKINRVEGKLIFLTARSSLAHEKTIKDLKNAGLRNPEDFEIHYTGNNITKGFYILKHNLLHGYNHHTFIDDNPYFIKSVLQLYPHMNCYLFKYT